MRIVLLAAGRGTRISKEINEVPKCTLEIEKGVPLIRYTTELLLKNNIDVSIVVGFKKEEILRVLDGLPVKVYYNPFYDVTNSIASFWFAKDFWADGDLLVMNADVYIEQDTLDLLKKEDRCPMMLVDPKRTIEGDYFFKYGSDDVLIKYGKELPVSERTGEYIGIAKLKQDFKNTFLTKLDELIAKQRHGDWWENILYALSEDKVNIFVRDIGKGFWSEIDKIEDYHGILHYKSTSGS